MAYKPSHLIRNPPNIGGVTYHYFVDYEVTVNII